jgi:uncharacterized protein (DUF433 family)
VLHLRYDNNVSLAREDLTQVIEKRTFTPSEAAVVSGVPLATIHKAIDDGPLGSVRERKVGKRVLLETDVVYLAASSIFDPKLMQLTDRAKARLRKAIDSSARKPGRIPFLEGLDLDLRPVMAKVRSKTALLDRAKKMVVVNPRIRGGEPVIRGTRIGVYEVAAMVEDATEEEREEILAGYPTLKREQLDLALIFAASHPRRGRPPRHPWHQS